MATKTKKAAAAAAADAPRRLQTTWMIDRPKYRPRFDEPRVTPFVSRDGTGACAWASRREAIEAAEADQGATWGMLSRRGWQVRRVTGIASELAR